MKKYINPEMEIMELNTNIAILAGSDTLPKGTDVISDPEDILAPEFSPFYE